VLWLLVSTNTLNRIQIQNTPPLFNAYLRGIFSFSLSFGGSHVLLYIYASTDLQNTKISARIYALNTEVKDRTESQYMTALSYLIPIALFMGFVGLLAFIWSVKTGQFEDLEGEASRILFDDDDALPTEDKTTSKKSSENNQT
jgi:cbb3-type cytochrome oxidase maturation protein